MTALTLPIGTIQATTATYSRETMVEQLKGLSGSSFTGYLAITSNDRLFLLFIFQGAPYSAGLAVGEKTTPLTITNFCAQWQLSMMVTEPSRCMQPIRCC